MSRIKLTDAAKVKEGGSFAFQYNSGGRLRDGFLARFKGQLVAYENRCRHLPVSLDFQEGTFFSTDGEHFVCQNHNALYEPLTGFCTRGPCEGESLFRLNIEIVDGEVWLIA